MSRDKKPLLYAAGIALLGVLAYRSSLFGKFLLDDLTLIVFNFHIRDLSGAAQLFTENIGAGIGQEVSSGFYRPLQILSYAFDFRLWNLGYTGYHITNLALHILTALSAYWFIRLISKKDLLSFLAAALFAVHPVNTEAVSYISGRADPLCALFVFLCLICYIKYLDTSDMKYYLAFPLCYLCALLSREGGMILLAFIPLYHFSFRRKLRLADIAPFLIVTAVYILMRSFALKSMLPHYHSPASALQRVAGSFAAFSDYIRMLFLPYGLHMEYGRKVFNFNDPQVVAGLLLFALCAYFMFSRRDSRGLMFFSAAWFIAGLAPVSGVFPMGAYMAEHWLYLPSVGFFVLLSSAVIYLYRMERTRTAAVALIAVMLLAYTASTAKHNRYWSDPEAFYKRTLEYSPDSARMHTYLDLYYRMRPDSR
ncbi:MAG: hypothetical protein WC316_03275 [Candidatus Omnitrophota bacterium]|jgi:hypothetical protein